MSIVSTRPEIPFYAWNKGLLSITSQGTALTTSKTSTTVNALAAAETAIIKPDDGTVAVQIRWRFDGADNDSNVFDLYAQADPDDNDSYSLLGTVTVLNGTQSDGTYTFGDTVTIASEAHIDDIVTLSQADNIGSLALNMQGFSHLLLIATTLASTAAYIDWRRI